MREARIQIARACLGSDAAGSTPAPRLAPRRQSWRETLALIRSDIAFRCDYESKPVTSKTILRMMGHPGVTSVLRYRLQCFCFANGLPLLGHALKWCNLALYSLSISENARIAGGLYVAHPISIVIEAGAEIGERCVLFHQNTICPSPFFEPDAMPGPIVIGNDVVFAGGACAYGRIAVGDGCRIGSNSVVDRSFPPGSILMGVPARQINRLRTAHEGAP